MKKVLAVVLAAAFVGVVSFNVNAQVPNAAVYFDDGTYAQQQKDCPNAPVGTVLDHLNVVLNNVNSYVSAVEFSVSYPAAISWLGDTHSTPLHLGFSPSGVAISWALPQNAFGPMLAMQAQFVWMCDGCGGFDNSPVTVGPHGTTGFLRAVGWPNNNLIDLVGGTALICPLGVPTEEQTWGAIKSLYND
jgi:hypothetical protein